MSNTDSPKTSRISEVRLSANGLVNIQRSLYADDFTFVFGGKRYGCPSFIAEFLSPRISRLRSIDATVCEFIIEDDDSAHDFADILSLASGASLSVTDATYKFIKTICIKLWNREVFDILSNAFEGDLSSSNVLSRLQLLTEMEQNCENELEFCSSHFWELQTICDSSELDKLDIALIHQLISRPSLQLMSEDSLWRFIAQDHFREHLLFRLLLECLKSECL
jgi:hypothetical protein